MMKALSVSAVILGVFSPLLLATALHGSDCTLGSFTTDSKQCANKFFNEIADNSKVNCSVSYQAMASCIEREKKTCLAKSLSQQTKEQILNNAQQFISNEAFYCKHGMFHPQSLQEIPGCTKKFYRKAAKCEKKFYSLFDKRGTNTVDLCRSFSKAKRCMKKYLGKFCQPNATVRYKIRRYDDPYNPYCSSREDGSQEGIKLDSDTLLDQKFGRCTWRSYEKLIRNCTASFVETLKKNSGRKCKSTFRKYQSCEKVALLYCMKGFYSADELNGVVDESLNRRRESDRVRLCSQAHIIIPPINAGQCKEGYNMTIQACDDKMSETYKAHRADPSLCREYAQTKMCAKKVTKAMCTMNTNIKAFMEFYYDNFNPFCSGLSDPA